MVEVVARNAKLTPSLVSTMPKVRGKSKAEKKRCPICKDTFHYYGFNAHFKKCARVKKAEDGLKEYRHEMTKMLYTEGMFVNSCPCKCNLRSLPGLDS